MDRATVLGAVPQVKERKAGGQVMPLSMVACGENCLVTNVRAKGDQGRFLSNLGFVEGAQLGVTCEMGGNLIVDVKGSRIALSQRLAHKILVQPVSA